MHVRKKSSTFAAMYDHFRYIVGVLVLFLMSMFVVALVADDWSDTRHSLTEVCEEVLEEWTEEESEWDDEDVLFVGGQNIGIVPLCEISLMNLHVSPVVSVAHQSDEQKRGLVRLYAPRKALYSYNYI